MQQATTSIDAKTCILVLDLLSIASNVVFSMAGDHVDGGLSCLRLLSLSASNNVDENAK